MKIKGGLKIPDQEVRMDNSTTLKGRLVGPDHTEDSPQYISSANVSEATLTLYDQDGSAIGAADRDVAAGFDTDGNFRWVLSATDNAWVGAGTEDYQDHIAKLTAVFSAGAGESHTIKENIRIRVVRLERP